MKKDLDIKFSVIKKPKLWVLQVESSDEMDDQEGLMAIIISTFKFAEGHGIDRDTMVDAILDNLESLDDRDAFRSSLKVVRELPRGDA